MRARWRKRQTKYSGAKTQRKTWTFTVKSVNFRRRPSEESQKGYTEGLGGGILLLSNVASNSSTTFKVVSHSLISLNIFKEKWCGLSQLSSFGPLECGLSQPSSLACGESPHLTWRAVSLKNAAINPITAWTTVDGAQDICTQEGCGLSPPSRSTRNKMWSAKGQLDRLPLP